MKWIGIYVICHFLVQTASHEYGIQLDYERPHQHHHIYDQKQITPLVLMVDATNRLGFSILKQHTFNNNNNVAFSPCGLASVLIALFEGSDGHSSFEIHKALELPFDRDLVRVGYRDIHRRLRSYFYQNENVLSGLSLSQENVTIRTGYESILRFYGYDLAYPEEGNVGLVTTTQFNRREEDAPETTTSVQTTVRTIDTLTTTPRVFITSTAVSDATTVRTEPPSTQLSDDKVTEISSTTFTPTEKSTEVQVDTTTETFSETTARPTEPVKLTTTIRTTLPITTTPATTTPATTTIQTTTPTEIPTLPETTTTLPTIQTTYPPTEETTVSLTTEMMTTTLKPTHIFKFKPITTTQLPDPVTKRFYNVLTTLPPLPAVRSAVTDSTNIPNLLTTVPVPAPTAIQLNPSDISTNARFINLRNSKAFRVKKDAASYKSFIPLPPSSYGVPPDVNYFDPYFSYATPNPRDLYYPENNPVFIATKDFDYDDHHHDEIDHIFYLNPHDSIRVGYRVYNTILRYAYIPGIQASVLELPLDSENYSLLIMVPDQPVDDMVDILCSHLSPSLITIRASLRDNWIRTMIPKFHLRGNVVLTGDLMKMGIHDIFEPNKADFSPMTDEFGIYARHIEQSITINIRTHANNQLRRYAQQFFDPIKVPVNRPFVFAIVDNEMDLAIMVGRVLNPINSRIF
ncbi:hypothetical protein HA402_007462 [Bradysia odoriphaga]|nr:hypothetical protein HA402_007462 [Bradysia odoriphaga]